MEQSRFSPVKMYSPHALWRGINLRFSRICGQLFCESFLYVNTVKFSVLFDCRRRLFFKVVDNFGFLFFYGKVPEGGSRDTPLNQTAYILYMVERQYFIAVRLHLKRSGRLGTIRFCDAFQCRQDMAQKNREPENPVRDWTIS